MTYKEAMAVIKIAKEDAMGKGKTLWPEAFDVAIAALEKQEPVKPEHHTCGAGDYYSCPKCGNRGVNDYYGYYCDNCGQLLSWKGDAE